jgi:hypothetical protein
MLGIPVLLSEPYIVLQGGRRGVFLAAPTSDWPLTPEFPTTINFRVSDVQEMLAQLRSHRAEVEDEVVYIDDVGWLGHARDPEGNRFELLEPAAAHLAAIAAEEEERSERVLAVVRPGLADDKAAERGQRKDPGVESDEDLDERIWLNLCELVGDDLETVRRLEADQRAYFVTRWFEWESLNASDAFLDCCPDFLDLVEPAYAHLGLNDSAARFAEFRDSSVVKRYLRTPDRVTADEHSQLHSLVTAIGVHDAERAAFARAHPQSFPSISER